MSKTPPQSSTVLPMKQRFGLVAVILVVTLLPAVLMLGIAYLGTGTAQPAATWASLPAVAGIAAAATGGRRFAVNAAIVTGMAAPLCIVAGGSPVSGAALMGLMALFVGRLSLIGLHKSALLYPVMMSWAVINPPIWAGQTTVNREDTVYLLWMTAIFFVGALIPALAIPRLMRKQPTPQLRQYSRHEALPYTVMITVLVTGATYVVLANPKLYGGAFLIAAILVLAPIGDSETLRPTLWRIFGTLVGSVILLALLARVSSLTVIYIFGLVFIIVALMARFSGYGWIYYVFMMPATAALNATTLSQVSTLGEQRLGDNIVGGALVLLATAAATGYASWAERHGHATDEDREVDAVLVDSGLTPSPTT